MFKGSNVALITPFKNNGLDEEAYIKLIHFHMDNGTSGLVPAGTTGESPTLSHDEHQRVIDLCIRESKGKIPVIAGTGSNSTEEAISLTSHAEKAGADGALIVTPYYNKPTQEGLYQHYKAINDKCGIPIIIYNIPSRSVIDMSVDTMARLFELKNIVGVKDATGDLNRLDQTIKKLGSEFIQLTGEDGLALERIFDKINAQELNNPNKLSCFVTVTCEYTKFDNPLRKTAGEYLYWNSNGGAISLITTTRQIFISVGVAFNKNLTQ